MKQQEIAAARTHSYGCHLDEIPRTGRETSRTGSLSRPIYKLVIGEYGNIGTLLGGNLSLLTKKNAERAGHKQDETIPTHTGTPFTALIWNFHLDTLS